MKEWKRYNARDMDKLHSRFMRLHAEHIHNYTPTPPPPQVSLHVYYVLDIFHVPLYVYGRYCKYARDVPQSPWLLSEDDDGVGGGGCKSSDDTVGDDGEDEDGDGNGDKGDGSAVVSQKGRDSIEEIVGYAVKKIIGGEDTLVKLHACGREDIDVRCLGEYSCVYESAPYIPCTYPYPYSYSYSYR
ncbi:hypothetical protein EON63_09620 [archaeon]|nr:MAG: hypothetical protein EON63_09620 [archaeon]